MSEDILFAGSRMSFDLGSNRAAMNSVRQKIQSFEAKRTSMSPKNGNSRPSQRMDREILRMAEHKAQEMTIDSTDEYDAPVAPTTPSRNSTNSKRSQYNQNYNHHFQPNSYYGSHSFNSQSFGSHSRDFEENTTNDSLTNSNSFIQQQKSFDHVEAISGPISHSVPAPNSSFIDIQPLIDEKDFEVNISTYSIPLEVKQEQKVNKFTGIGRMDENSNLDLWKMSEKKESSMTVATEDTENSESTVSSLGQEGPEEIVEKIEKKKSLRWKEELVEICDLPFKYEEHDKRNEKGKMNKPKKSIWMRFVCGVNQ